MTSFLPYGKQDISDSDIEAVVSTLKSDYLTQGPLIEKFEQALCAYTGAKYATVFNSATSALHAAYFALGLQEGDELITSPNTFVATSNAGLYLGAQPVFCDVNPANGNLDHAQLEALITEKTKVIVPVHYSGQPCDMKAIAEIANQYGLKVVEDASHAVGANYENTKTGDCTYSNISVFSFHPVKIITSGEGGAAFTNSAEEDRLMKQFRSHGVTKQGLVQESPGPWYYEMQHLGYNYRMTDIHAALGLSQLQRLEEFVCRRRELAHQYFDAFKDQPYFDCLSVRDINESSFHLFPILLNDDLKVKKKEIFNLLRERNIGVQTHYIPVHTQPYYQTNVCPGATFSGAEAFYSREISIPMYALLTNEEQQYIVNTLLEVLKILSDES